MTMKRQFRDNGRVVCGNEEETDPPTFEEYEAAREGTNDLARVPGQLLMDLMAELEDGARNLQHAVVASPSSADTICSSASK